MPHHFITQGRSPRRPTLGGRPEPRWGSLRVMPDPGQTAWPAKRAALRRSRNAVSVAEPRTALVRNAVRGHISAANCSRSQKTNEAVPFVFRAFVIKSECVRPPHVNSDEPTCVSYVSPSIWKTGVGSNPSHCWITWPKTARKSV